MVSSIYDRVTTIYANGQARLWTWREGSCTTAIYYQLPVGEKIPGDGFGSRYKSMKQLLAEEEGNVDNPQCAVTLPSRWQLERINSTHGSKPKFRGASLW